MDSQQNNIAATLARLYDKAGDGEENYMKSDVLPPNNPPEIRKNRVDIEGDLQGIVRLTLPQLKFLEMVADAIRPAAMLGKLKTAPTKIMTMEDSKTHFRKLRGENVPGHLRQPSVAMQTEIFTPKMKPVLQQLVVKRCDNHAKFARRYVFPADVLLAKALRQAAIPMLENADVIEGQSIENIKEDRDSRKMQLSIKSVTSDSQQPSTIEENIERVRRRSIVSALGRRLLKVGRWLTVVLLVRQ
ncbi:unnamed protein product [Macrosiphum euphorbiae]|uniref:Uncharacterized protein n=1 Tax=Macrosiphum euphorbiae TaxID=13131 RepID=A0AAV0W3P4_9HEMI|nr:unnamed protein product [Macrosiphum euphorbiae]